MNTFNLRLDLDKARTLPLLVTIRQGDKSGTTIAATIYDHGTQLVGTYNARVVIGNPDGEHYYRKNATYSSGVATVTIDEQEAASVTGNTVGYFEILQGSTVIASTANFGVRILPSALDGAEPGEVYDSAIQDAIDGLNDAVNALPTTVEGILEDHPEWTTTVQDGSISVPKLSSDVRSSLSGAAILAAVGGTLAQAHDASAAPPNALALYGRSTQSGTPTPSSPKAITSVTAAGFTFGGRNLIQPLITQTTTLNGVTYTPLDDGSFRTSGTATANSQNVGDRQLLPAGTYRLSGCPSGGSQSTYFLRALAYDSASGGTIKANVTDYGSGTTMTLASPLWVLIFNSVANGTAAPSALWTPQIEVGSTATPYKPYDPSSTTLAIDLQGHELRSLPDGTRDELQVGADGHVTLVQRVGSVDMGTLSWTQHGVLADCFYSTPNASPSLLPDGLMASGTWSGAPSALLCAGLSVVSTNSINGITGHDNVVCMSVGNPYLYACDADSATAAAFKAAMSGITLLYKLATPTTIDLGYVTLPTLPAPDLTAWAAQGAELGITYQRDATLVIAGIYAQLAPVDGPTATSNHGVGTYLMLGGTLCRVTTAIAVGEQITIGTNVVATTVMTEILALTA